MSKVSSTSRVRRRLFPDDDVTTQANLDNTTNNIQESLERDIQEKIQKWNFDFENDVPLTGIYEWTPCNNESRDWIGRKITNVNMETDLESSRDISTEEVDKHNVLSIKDINEITPRPYKMDEDAVPIRKRKQEDFDGKDLDKGVRRKISFE